MKENLPVTDQRIDYPDSYRILSTTDLKGQIKHMNDDFVEVSGFTYDELINKSHNYVRHPSMPPEAFANLWKTIQAGECWMGLVKNRCKNGDYYWVDAFVTPIKKHGETAEYQSVRTKPSAGQISRAEQCYKKIEVAPKVSIFYFWQKISIFNKSWLLNILAWSPLMISVVSESSQGLQMSACAFALITSFLLNRVIAKPLSYLADKSKKVFDNPLMKYIYTGRHDDLAQIELALKMYSSQLDAVVSRIDNDTDDLVGLAGQVKENVNQSNHLVNEQQKEITQVATAVHEMAATAQEISGTTKNNAKNLEDTLVYVNQGNEEMTNAGKQFHALQNSLQEASNQTETLNQQSNEIGHVITVIKEIADQTNLLALNAAIEAARAGEQGRGFSVVADEVRALANRTQESTDQIQKNIEQLQAGTKNVVAAVQEGSAKIETSVASINQVASSLDSVHSNINQISNATHQVAEAVQEQAQVSEELNKNITAINDMAENLTGLATNSAQSTFDMNQMMQEQQTLVRQFKG